MAALTVRLADDKHVRLKALAKSRGTPLNRLIDDMATAMLAMLPPALVVMLMQKWFVKGLVDTEK